MFLDIQPWDMVSRVENSMAIAVPVPSTKPLQFLTGGSSNTKQPYWLVSFLTATVISRILNNSSICLSSIFKAFFQGHEVKNGVMGEHITQ